MGYACEIRTLVDVQMIIALDASFYEDIKVSG
jgi:hypothetical protein